MNIKKFTMAAALIVATQMVFAVSNDGKLRLRTATPLRLADGTALKEAKGRNTNQLMQPYELPAPVIADRSKLEPVSVPTTQLYDLPTEAGHSYTLVAAEKTK